MGSEQPGLEGGTAWHRGALSGPASERSQSCHVLRRRKVPARGAVAGGAGGSGNLACGAGWRRWLSGLTGLPRPAQTRALVQVSIPGPAHHRRQAQGGGQGAGPCD